MDTLYREELLEHIKNPQNKGSLVSPSVEVIERNPLCGDVVQLQMKVEDDKIADAKFDGQSCGVCVAASSMLTDEIKGKSLKYAKDFSKEDLLNLIGVELTTSRIKCATLVLDALKNSIKIYEQKTK